MQGIQDVGGVDSRNRVLRALTDDETQRLAPHLELSELRLGDVLATAGQPVSHLYFPDAGLVSMVATAGSGATVEVAFSGNESVAGAVALLARDTLPFAMVVNLPGRAARVPFEIVRDAMTPDGKLLALVRSCVRLTTVQITQSVVCGRFHSPRQRLARWLALASDRAETDLIPMTHETIASMVGGARSMVTQASNELRELGVLDYRRGSLRILDAARLRSEACECYEVVTDAFKELESA